VTDAAAAILDHQDLSGLVSHSIHLQRGRNSSLHLGIADLRDNHKQTAKKRQLIFFHTIFALSGARRQRATPAIVIPATSLAATLFRKFARIKRIAETASAYLAEIMIPNAVRIDQYAWCCTFPTPLIYRW
jgi:hypothetical protein